MGSVSAYQVGGVHRHTPEIEQALAEATGVTPTLSFTPLLVPMPRGILATCTARLASPASPGRRTDPRTGSDALRQALATAYAGEPFIHVLPEGRWPATASTLGSNAVHLQVAADAHAGPGRGRGRPGQPGQGGGRASDPGRQPHARPARSGGPDG